MPSIINQRFSRNSIFHTLVTSLLAFMFVFTLTPSETSASQDDNMGDWVKTIHDSLHNQWVASSGEEHLILTYQLGMWCRNNDYDQIDPWDDRSEALYELAMFDRGFFELSNDVYPLQINGEDHTTGPHWTKAYRDLKKDLIYENFDHIYKSYYYSWPTLLDDIKYLADGTMLERAHDLEEAQKAFLEGLKVSESPVVRGELMRGVAKTLYRQGKFAASLDTLKSALDQGYFSTNILFDIGRTLIRLGRVSEAIDVFAFILEVNPYHENAHYYLGNGYSTLNYSQIMEKYPDCFADSSNIEILTDIRSLLKSGLQNEAVELLNSAIQLHPQWVETYIILASVNWQEENYSEAEAQCMEALKYCPSYGRAHAVIAKIQESRRLLISGRRLKQREKVRSIPEPIVPKIEEYIVNWDELTPRHKKIVALSVEPWKHFVPVLVSTNHTYYIKPLYELLSESPGMESLRNQRINLDSRLWDDVRGAGGYHTVTGIEDVERIYYGGYNTVIHELTHQVHGILTAPEQERIETQFRLSKEKDANGIETFMSRYQKSTVWEYFAEGANAYVSPMIDKYDDREIVRERLFELDTALVALVEHFFSVEDMMPYEAVGAVNSAYQMLERGDADSSWFHLQKIPEAFDSTRSVLSAKSYICSILDLDSLSTGYAEKYYTAYPHESDGYSLYTSALYTKNPFSEKIVPLLKSALEDTLNDDLSSLHLALGSQYLLTGEPELAYPSFVSALESQSDLPGGLWGQAVSLAELAIQKQDSTLQDSAFNVFEKLVTWRSGVMEYRLDFARYLLEAGLLGRAEQQINEVEILHPESPLAKSYRALFLVASEKPDEAQKIVGSIKQDLTPPDITYLVNAILGLQNAEEILNRFRSEAPYYIYNPDLYRYEIRGEYYPWYQRLVEEFRIAGIEE